MKETATNIQDLFTGAYPDEEHVVKILETEYVTHNVKRFKLTKPESKPGQATDIVINLPAWKKERRPFTFTGLNDWNTLEFTIKIYSDHKGVTNELGKLHVGDELILQKQDLRNKINEDIKSGMRCHVKNTPSIFINGHKYTGTVTFDNMAKVIEKI